VKSATRSLKHSVAALALFAAGVWALGPAAHGARAAAPAARQSLDFLASQVDAYAGPLGPYQDGIWRSPNAICWACNNGGPATAAATAYMLTGRSQPRLLTDAEGTFDTAIATRQLPDGSFVPPVGDSQPAGIATIFFSIELGNTYLELLPVLSPARAARWRSSLAAAAFYLINNGNLTWYTNGNINLDLIELLYLAWQATGDPTLHAAYEQEWNFTLRPPRSRWPGCGLVTFTAPRDEAGSGVAGYLTETGSGGTGFDAEYSSLQLDTASRLYLLSGDPRALRLAKMLLNALLPRVDSSWQLDTSDGTRHTQSDRYVPLITSAFAVLGLHGGRSELSRFIVPQLDALEAAYAEPWNDYGEVYRRALGNDVAVIVLATNLAHPVGWAARVRPLAHSDRLRRRHGVNR
jgi:hypothetical protein